MLKQMINFYHLQQILIKKDYTSQQKVCSPLAGFDATLRRPSLTSSILGWPVLSLLAHPKAVGTLSRLFSSSCFLLTACEGAVIICPVPSTTTPSLSSCLGANSKTQKFLRNEASVALSPTVPLSFQVTQSFLLSSLSQTSDKHPSWFLPP
jgi:hypothetical protein